MRAKSSWSQWSSSIAIAAAVGVFVSVTVYTLLQFETLLLIVYLPQWWVRRGKPKHLVQFSKKQKTFPEASELAPGSTKPPVKWVLGNFPPRLKWPQCEAVYLSSSNVEWYCTTVLPSCCAQERFFWFKHNNLTRQATYVYTELRCHGRAICITYSVCLWVCSLNSSSMKCSWDIFSSVACLALHIFPHSHKRYDLRGENNLTQNTFWFFSTIFVWNIFHFKNSAARYHKLTQDFIWCARYSCRILMTVEFSR